MDIGERIAERRRELGISQEALAERIGAHAKTIGSIETGKTRFHSLERVKAICTELGLDPAEVLGVDAPSVAESA